MALRIINKRLNCLINFIKGIVLSKEIKNISFIGSGNVATQLAINLKNKGFKICQIYSRNYSNAEILAKKTDADAINDLSQLSPEADLYIVSVSDSAIEKLISSINIGDKIIVHTSGSISMNIFTQKFNNYGIFYPLQTFTKGKSVDFSNIPILIEANNNQSTVLLTDTAKKISNTVSFASSEERKRIHIAAIFANNFTNYFYTIAKQYLDENNLNFELIKPLIIETASKILENNPEDIQTGPAYRNDISTIKNHIEILKSKPELQKLYSFVSESILNLYKTKDE